MCPILLHLGPFTLYSYGLMFALAVIISSWLLSRDAVRQGIKSDVIYDMVFWVVVSGIVGARLYYIVGLFIIFLILKKLQKKSHPSGEIFAFYMMLAGIERFIVEFFRGDHVTIHFGLSNFQLIAIGVFTAGLIMDSMVHAKRK